MGKSSLTSPITTHPLRSNSAPIELHPYLSQFTDHFLRLESYSNTSTSHTVINHKLTSLVALHECVGNLLKLSSVQQEIRRKKSDKSLETLLDGSLWLIDVCDMARCILMQTKDGVQQLQSVLRRRPNKQDLVMEATVYFDSRKMVKKLITKALEQAKSFRRRINETASDFPHILEESQCISGDVFDSLLSYVVGSSTRSRTGKWRLLHTLVSSKKSLPEAGDCPQRSKFEVVDSILGTIICQKAAKSTLDSQTVKLKSYLKELESIVVDLERCMECLSVHFIKTRVTLLNILNC